AGVNDGRAVLYGAGAAPKHRRRALSGAQGDLRPTNRVDLGRVPALWRSGRHPTASAGMNTEAIIRLESLYRITAARPRPSAPLTACSLPLLGHCRWCLNREELWGYKDET